MNKINTLLIIALLVFSLSFVSTHSNETLLEAEHLIEEQTPCSELTETQLAAIGDYYMEQSHPGEEHEYMDAMMGGEGSESLEQMHISMAYRFYCDESYDGTYSGTYGMMEDNMPMMGYYNNSYSTGFQWLPLSVAIVIVLLVVLIALQIKKK